MGRAEAVSPFVEGDILPARIISSLTDDHAGESLSTRRGVEDGKSGGKYSTLAYSMVFS